MFTIEYRGLYINGYCDKKECTAVFDNGVVFGKFPTVRAAKNRIGKLINDLDFCNKR